MRVQPAREDRLAALGHAPRHHDRFPARGRAVVHRRIRHVAAEQPRDLRLELEHHLQRALRDLGLVRRVGGEELAALDQMIDRWPAHDAIRPAPRKNGASPPRGSSSPAPHVPLDREFAGVQRQADGSARRAALRRARRRTDRRSTWRRSWPASPAVGMGKGQIAHLVPSQLVLVGAPSAGVQLRISVGTMPKTRSMPPSPVQFLSSTRPAMTT
jgi:hypothetical protein